MAGERKNKTLTFDGEDFQEDFDSECYLQQFWPGCDPDNPDHDLIITTMNLLHQLFDGGKYSGKSLLDIGSGPTIYNVMSASKTFPNIYLSDYTKKNLEALEKWKARDKSAHDWSPFFNYVSTLEGNSAGMIEERLRSAIKGIFHCDLRKDLPLGEEQDRIAPLDAIICCWTLEVVVKEDEKLSDYYKKFYDMLKDGGLFVTMAIGKMSFYYQSGKRYWARGFPKKMVEGSLLEAGFIDIHMIDIPLAKTSAQREFSDEDDNCMYYATKKMLKKTSKKWSSH